MRTYSVESVDTFLCTSSISAEKRSQILDRAREKAEKGNGSEGRFPESDLRYVMGDEWLAVMYYNDHLTPSP